MIRQTSNRAICVHRENNADLRVRYKMPKPRN